MPAPGRGAARARAPSSGAGQWGAVGFAEAGRGLQTAARGLRAAGRGLRTVGRGAGQRGRGPGSGAGAPDSEMEGSGQRSGGLWAAGPGVWGRGAGRSAGGGPPPWRRREPRAGPVSWWVPSRSPEWGGGSSPLHLPGSCAPGVPQVCARCAGDVPGWAGKCQAGALWERARGAAGVPAPLRGRRSKELGRIRLSFSASRTLKVSKRGRQLNLKYSYIRMFWQPE